MQVRKSDSGKVSIYRVPTAKERAMAQDALIGPSEGYEIPTGNTLKWAS